MVHQFRGRQLDLVLEVTAYESCRAFAAHVVAGPIRFRGAWRYEPIEGGSGTRISGVIEAEAEGFFRLAEPLVARAATRQIAADCDTLRDLLESRTGPAA